MRDEFIITRQGKQYVLFAGLLDEAHRIFDKLFTISTEILELEPIPIVKATFSGDTKDGKSVCTSGIGTGKRESDTKGPGKDAPVEMAETRAKARALRDAVNVGATSLEEMDGDGDTATPQYSSFKPSKPPHSPAKTRQGSTPTPTNPKPSEGSPASPVPSEATNKQEAALQATRQQIAKLNKLMEFRSVQTEQSVEEIREGFVDFIGFPIKDLSRGEADKYIRKIERKIEQHEGDPEEEAS